MIHASSCRRFGLKQCRIYTDQLNCQSQTASHAFHKNLPAYSHPQNAPAMRVRLCASITVILKHSKNLETKRANCRVAFKQVLHTRRITLVASQQLAQSQDLTPTPTARSRISFLRYFCANQFDGFSWKCTCNVVHRPQPKSE